MILIRSVKISVWFIKHTLAIAFHCWMKYSLKIIFIKITLKFLVSFRLDWCIKKDIKYTSTRIIISDLS